MIRSTTRRARSQCIRWAPGPACLLGILAVALTGRPAAPTAAAADAPALPATTPATAAADGLTVGAAKVDVTPTTPIRLCGYAARGTESDGVETPLHARALAVGDSAGKPAAVVVALDATGVSSALADEVAGRVEAKVGVPRERFVLACTHTHAAPCLTDTLPNIFGRPIPPDHQERIDRYTRALADKLTEAALAAVADLKPGTLSVARGTAGFATNRRKQGGPVDRELSVLVARRADRAVRAVWMNYACHATTLGADNNKVNADWPGYAAAGVEQDVPGAVALVTLGCGADANPIPRGTLALAQKYGGEAAAEVKRLLAPAAAADAKPVRGVPAGQLKRFELAYDALPTREQWEALAKRPDAIGFNAKTQLARLAAGKPIPTTLPYRVQSLRFGDDLTMVFLAGEVVVDYALRLKHDFDPAKLWVTAYANDVPCYIPSRRVLTEGGYEAEGAMVYYGRPGKLAPAVENDIVRAVHEVVPPAFRSKQSLNEFPPAKSVDESLKAFKLPDGLTIEAVATEPLVESPIAVDWDPAGRLWVLEMRDYPNGLHEDGAPGGRVKVLTDTDGDGRYDKAVVFLDHLPFPQGIMCWRRGVLVGAAPDVIYAEDADGDGVATGDKDVRKVLFSGFLPDNKQWTVNGFAWGLDGWVYAASSIANDDIRVGGTDRTIDLGGRDFRMNPDALAFEPAAGRTQFCRVRDDFDEWFGNDNSNPLWHYPLPERYVRRNPHVPPPSPRVAVATGADANRLFPISRTLERFNTPNSANRVTSACGPSIYRDRLLGDGFYGNAFYCEPVHNVVQRLALSRTGVSFAGHRTPDNLASEFLSSTDNWFRPVQTRTGPDGALWVVDMHRFVIEHTRWITPERLATLDVRAGAQTGRIYRIYPKGQPPRRVAPIAELPTAELAGRLDSTNGTLRDLVHRELVKRPDAASAAVGPLVNLARSAADPAVRVQAMYALDGLGSLPRYPGGGLGRGPAAQAAPPNASSPPREEPPPQPSPGVPGEGAEPAAPIAAAANGAAAAGSQSHLPADVLLAGLSADRSEVRVASVRLSERRLSADPALAAAVLKLAGDPDLTVRYQLALSLGEWDDARVPAALAGLAASAPDDGYVRAAVLSSSARRTGEVLAAVSALLPAATPARVDLTRQLAVTLAATAADSRGVDDAVRAVTPGRGAAAAAWQYAALSAVADAVDGRAQPLRVAEAEAAGLPPDGEPDVATRYRRAVDGAAAVAADPKAAVGVRADAVGLLGRQFGDRHGGLPDLYRDAKDGAADDARRERYAEVLAALLRADVPPAVQQAAVAAVARRTDAATADRLVAAWAGVSPSVKPRVFDALAGRRAWVDVLLAGVEAKRVPAADLSAADRDRLLKHDDAAVRERAAKAFASIAKPGSRSAAVAKAKPALSLKADPAAGARVFAKVCATCHQLNGVGHAVGPNLAAVTDRSGPALLNAIVDPNAAVDGRFAAYKVETADDRTLVGLLADESAAGFTVLQGGGVKEAVSRSAVRKVVNTGLSLMPEGLEAGLSPQELADVIAYAQSNETPRTLADLLLKPSVSVAEKDEALARRPDLAVEAVRAMAADLKPGTPAQYARIPSLWRASLGVGKRNDADEVRRLLAVALPRPGQPLADWQAVVLGGGAVNGMSLAGVWPAERMTELTTGDDDLAARWRRAVELSKPTADDPKVKPGTRYDALRLVALAGWDAASGTLAPYLAKDAHPELQQGAVSGLSDVRDPRAADALLAAWPNLIPRNRTFAFDALLRDEGRALKLVDAVTAGLLPRSDLDGSQQARLRGHASPVVRARAAEVLGGPAAPAQP